MKTVLSACAVSLALTSCACAQTFTSPGVSRMQAAYDPDAGAVVLTNQPSRIIDYQVQPAQVYQPPGRAYGVTTPPAAGATTVSPPVSGFGAPVYGSPNAVAAPTTVAPGATFMSPSDCPPVHATPGYVDPYTCQPLYAQPSMAAPLAVAPSSAARQAYSEIEGRAGDPAEVLQGNLMIPFWQQPSIHWFFDVRGQYDDERAGEGNFGVARRQLMSNGLFNTIYASYDVRHTANNNNFQQGMVGFEMMSLVWEYRVNGYLPFSGTRTTGQNVASILNDDIVIQQGLERAYYGIDGEYGILLGDSSDHEIRAFIGGYYFDTDRTGFRSFGGPRARLEGRRYDLPLLGPGSRFTYGVSYQWDEVRDSQWIASVNLRIPFGRARNSGSTLTPTQRRFLSPLRRELAIVTGGGLSAPEQAVITSTGQIATNVTQINAATADVPTAVAGGSDIVVVTENVDTTATVVMNPNQFLGGQFAVHGQNTGAQATFGTRTTINATGADAVRIANNTTVTGLNITGDQEGIIGGAALPGGVSGFTPFQQHDYGFGRQRHQPGRRGPRRHPRQHPQRQLC